MSPRPHQILFPVTSLAILLLLARPALAAPPMLVDQAGLLGDADAAALEQKLAALSEQYLCDTVIITVNSIGDYTRQETMQSYYMDGGYGTGEKIGCLMLLYCLEDRAWRLACWGEVDAFTNAGFEFISERLEDDGMNEGNFIAVFNSFADWCEKFYEQAQTGEPYDEGHLPHTISSINMAISALIILSLIMQGVLI